MAAARITIGDTETLIAVDDADAAYTIPRGARSLADEHLHDDPPLPEQLTNAIGDILDHLDDARRELPELAGAAPITLAGALPAAIAAVEVGGTVDGAAFTLRRDAAEDVFRTLATEASRDRRHNPGLPADLVGTVVAGCCIVVAVYRGLHLDEALIDLDVAGRQ